MRTTIELPTALRQEIVTEAARQNLKGFSPIIVKALKEYFENHKSADVQNGIRGLRGSLARDEYEQAMNLLESGRHQWKM
ncbi:MAG: hypothetical protein U9N32_07285 [Spirochaetota bacterium]|nr:hypothetical protein [Spirochaetota bacterium]